jgi:hypothetical protein
MVRHCRIIPVSNSNPIFNDEEDYSYGSVLKKTPELYTENFCWLLRILGIQYSTVRNKAYYYLYQQPTNNAEGWPI